MYCNYTYLPGASASDIKNDLIKLVTADNLTSGDVLRSSLSSSCDKTNTLITKTTATSSGWDTVAGSLNIASSETISLVSTTIDMPANLRWMDVIRVGIWYWLVGKAATITTSTNIIYKTKDFKTFTSVTLPYTASWHKLLYVETTSVSVLSVYAGGDEATSNDDTTFVYSDDNGSTWKLSNFNATVNVKSITVASYSGMMQVVLLAENYFSTGTPTATIYTSSDGKSWSINGGSYPSIPSGGVGISGSTAGGLLNGDYYTAFAVGASDINGNPYPPHFMSIGGANSAYATGAGSNRMVVSNNGGGTFYQHNAPVTTFWAGVAFGDGIFVIAPGGQNNTSTNIVSVYFHKLDATTYQGNQTWTISTLSQPMQIHSITYHKGYFVILGGNDTSKSSVIQLGKYDKVTNTITWEVKALDSQGNWSAAVTCSNDLVILSGSRISGSYASNFGVLAKITSAANYNSHIRAVNMDGSSYKYTNISVSNDRVTLRSAESFSGTSYTNLIFNSDIPRYSQLLDLDNGGVIFVACSNRFLALFGYRPTTNHFGAVDESWCGVFEYTRDDAWSNVNGSTYPTHVFITPYSIKLKLTTVTDTYPPLYVPRLKNSISAPDINGSTAKLYASVGVDVSNKILNSTGTGTAHIAADIRVSNTSDFTYSILGGVVLGGIKRTTESQGSNLEEAVLNNTTYVIWEGGKTFPNARYLIPKV